MKNVYTFTDLQAWDDVTAAETVPLRLAVIGDPVAHSASPPMHNAALAACGINARYCRLHIRPEEFPDALRLLSNKGFIGVNCTIPHKAAALAAVDGANENAQRAGGVNTIVFGTDGKSRGFSTDGAGLARAVREEFGVNFPDMRVLVLGAGGGAGRAVAMHCAAEGVRYLILQNRTEEKLAPLFSEIGKFFDRHHLAIAASDPIEFSENILESDLIVNCSALGMAACDPSPVDAEALRPRHLVYDTIYTAQRTPLMLAADAAGARSANGLSMLLHQGALAFELWFDRPAPIEAMRAALLAPAPR